MDHALSPIGDTPWIQGEGHMKISTRGRYALRMMLDLMRHDDGRYITLKDISRREDISVKYLEQIVPALCRSGLLRSVRGPAGGYRLARRPEEYSIGDILRAAGESLTPVACLENEPNLCPRYQTCPTIKFWKGLSSAINSYVDTYSLKDLDEQFNPSAGEFFWPQI